jgi:TP901 family phage tail tape measure protein
MADENIVTNIVAKADFSNLIGDLNKVSFSLTKLQDQLVASNKMLAAQVGVMNRSFADTLRSTGQFSTHFVSLTSDVDKFGSQLDKGQMKLGKFFQVYRQHASTSGGLVRDLAKQQVQLQNAIMQPLGKNAQGLMQYNVHIPRGLDLIKNKSAVARQELQIMNKVVQEGANSLINWGKNTQWAGRQLTVGLTVPLAAFGKATADAFKQADEQLVRLTKVYGGLSAVSTQELGKVRADVSRTAEDLAKSYGASFKDTIALAADIAATGKTGNELLGSIRETTRLSVLGEVDRQDAMKATLAIQTAFKQNTDQLSESINFLNAVENQTSTTLNDLVEAIPKAGPIVRGLGGDVKDLALYLTAMREGGINASEGANALKSGLASLINPTKVAKGMFSDLGISLTDIVSKNAGNTTATILELQAALETLNPLQKQQALEQLFGKFQFARMNALFENLGKQGSQTLQVMDLMKASSQELGDLATRELGQVTESASGKYRRAVEGLKADLAGIGEQFLKINTSLINFVDGIIKFVQKLPDPIKQALGFMGMLTAAAGPLIMLTGVLGNFFGYIIKGAYHFKSLFKGGEGWKLLTPEILAAQKAGNLVEQTFYSDAKAAAVLKQAIAGLTAEFTILQQKASSAAMSVNPAISTVAGGVIVPGQRVVNPGNPLAGAMGTRAAGHHIPRSVMSQSERDAQTLHSFTPVPIPLNQKIGAVPQIFTEGDLPRIPGLTVSGGASTGIVAGEAAKWHALMGTLSMLSKREVADLKKEIARTGTFSTEINSTFGQLLPAMTNLTSNAAKQSAAIVAQLQSGKITVEAARAKIIAINAQLEAMMAQTTTQVATDLGRTANLTQVPLINQPIVGPTGKANIKELFRAKRPSAGIVDKIARALGVRTYGAGYSTETTMPKRMNAGGNVVPGPNVNADVVPALLTPGEFVVNREATAANLPLLQALNNNRGSDGPGYNDGSRQGIKDKYAGRQFAHLDDNITINPSQYGYLSSQFGLSSIGKDKTLFDDSRTAVKSSFVAAYDKWFNQGTNKGTLPIDDAISYFSGERVNGTVHNPSIAYSALMDDLGLTNPVDRQQFAKDIDSQILADLKAQKSSGKMLLADRIAGKTKNQRAKTSLIGESITNTVKSKYPSKLPMLSDLKRPAEIRFNTGKGSVTSASTGKTRGSGKQRRSLKQSDLISAREAAIFGGNNVPAPIMRGHGATMVAGIREAQQKKYNQQDSALLRAMRAGASRGRIKLNAGGMVQGYNRGGGPVSAFTSGLRNPYGKSLVSGGMNIPQMGMGAQMGIGMGGMMAGSMIGGPAGIGLMIASNLLPMMSGLKGLGGLTPTITKLAGVLGKLTIPGAVIGGAFMLGKYLLDIKKNAEDAGEANRLAFGGTQESFTSVGITKFKTLSDRLKEVNEQMELNKVKAKSLFESYTKAGPTGVTLSIKELNEAIENATKNQTEYVKAFNNIDSSGVNKYAADLKAQFVAMGLSASEASNQIFAMIKASEKAGQAMSAVTTTDFRNIIDQTTALTRLFDNLSKASTVTNFNAEEFAQGLDTLINSVIAYQESLIGTKDAFKNEIDSAESLRMTMEKIGSIRKSDAMLNTESINKLKEQNVIYASILSNMESLESITAKILLYNSQMGSYLDLSKMNAESAVALANNFAKVQEGVNAITESADKSNPLASLSSAINKADSSAKNYQNSIKSAQKQDEEYYSKKIKLIDLEIKKIREAADAKRKALQEQQDEESYSTEVKKLQIEYQNALASGDMSRAAQAQLNLQQLNKEKQTRDAIEAISKKESEDLKKKEDEKEKIRQAEDKFAKGVQSNASKQTEENANASELKSFREQINSATIAFRAAQKQSGKIASEGKNTALGSATVTLESMRTGSKKAQEEYAKLLTQYGLKASDGPASLAGKLVADVNKSITDSPSNTAFKSAVEAFDLAVAKFAGTTAKTISGNEYGRILPNALDYIKAGASGKLETAENATRLIREQGLKPGETFSYGGNSFKVNKDGKTLSKLAMGGYIRNYEMGSFGGVRGPGTGTSDSIPAMLSNGEYVLRASAVNAVGVPLLDEINKMAMGGLAARYDVSKKMAMPSNTMGYNKGGPIQNYNVGGLTMNFANGGEVNGRMVYEQFKGAMALERLKSGGGGRSI